MFDRKSVGGLLLEEAAGWTFGVHDGVIAGRYREEPGVLFITTVSSNALPHPVTHDMCLKCAGAFAQALNPQPSDWLTSESATGPFGSFNFDRGDDRVFAWYCCRAPGVILGIYSCPIDDARTFANRSLRLQCKEMITTAVFDRRTWGANDELTRLLISLLGTDNKQNEK